MSEFWPYSKTMILFCWRPSLLDLPTLSRLWMILFCWKDFHSPAILSHSPDIKETVWAILSFSRRCSNSYNSRFPTNIPRNFHYLGKRITDNLCSLFFHRTSKALPKPYRFSQVPVFNSNCILNKNTYTVLTFLCHAHELMILSQIVFNYGASN